MKTNTYISILAIGMILLLSSCSKILDKTDLNSFSGSQVFNNQNLANLYLNEIYNDNSPGWPSGRWEQVTGEIPGGSPYFEGTVQVNTVGDFGTSLNNNTVWGKLRAINQFIQKVKGGNLSSSEKKVMIGQAVFFRAWDYFQLVKLYGGVPLVLKPQNAIGPKKEIAEDLPRSSTSDCIKQITADLDTAIVDLPGRWEGNDWGRITSGAAAALKGWVLLYWASPQFNPSALESRYQAAYAANEQAMTILTNNGYGLNPSFQNMWFQGVDNPEAVWVVCYNSATGHDVSKNEGWDNATRPSYLGTGGGSNQPTQEIVNAFPMKNGLSITNPSSGYDSTLFYKNRGPRFYDTIAYNGCNWHIDGNPNYRLWTYYVGNTSIEPTATQTGFYCKKAINPDLKASQVQYAGTNWMEIRFAEVVLNLAESACGVNKLNQAYQGLEQIRKRAGIEAGSNGLYGLTPNMDQAQMFKAILHERQIEFAFEGKRYWDLRRWKLFGSLLNGKRRMGVTIELDTSKVSAGKFAAERDTLSLDYAYEHYFKVTPKVLDTKYAINWQPNYYFFAIPQQAIDNDPKLKQTDGWPGGTFDPLK